MKQENIHKKRWRDRSFTQFETIFNIHRQKKEVKMIKWMTSLLWYKKNWINENKSTDVSER